MILAAMNRTREQCKRLIKLINSMQSMQKWWLFEIVGRTMVKCNISLLKMLQVLTSYISFLCADWGTLDAQEKLRTGEGVNKDLTCEKSMCERGRGARAWAGWLNWYQFNGTIMLQKAIQEKKNNAKDAKIKCRNIFWLHLVMRKCTQNSPKNLQNNRKDSYLR